MVAAEEPLEVEAEAGELGEAVAIQKLVGTTATGLPQVAATPTTSTKGPPMAEAAGKATIRREGEDGAAGEVVGADLTVEGEGEGTKVMLPRVAQGAAAVGETGARLMTACLPTRSGGSR